MVVVYSGSDADVDQRRIRPALCRPLALLDGHGERLADDASPLRRAARGEAFRMRFTIDGANGGDRGRRLFEASGEPIAGPCDEPGGVVIIRDVTER